MVHDCEKLVVGFDESERIIQKELGPIHLRFVEHGLMFRNSDGNFRGWSNEYKEYYEWTGGAQKSVNSAANAISNQKMIQKEEKISQLGDLIVNFIRNYSNERDNHFTIISPPRGSNGKCSKNFQKKHLGYKIGKKVAKQIRDETDYVVKHLMAYDLYECNFPIGITEKNWLKKPQQKQGLWIDDAHDLNKSSIGKSSMVIIVDDTMISYMSMIRIAMSVRKYNADCVILCAAVFGLTEARDSPDDLYFVLRDFVNNNQKGRSGG